MPGITEQQVLSIVQKVYDMREAQNAYFKNRTDGNLKRSMALEQKVDAVVEYFISKKLIERKQPPPPPAKLFG